MEFVNDFESLKISERKIIVGIDFGTTYSGIAWAETQRPDRRQAITAWPISKTSHEGESSDKIPTRIRYTNAAATDLEWGSQISVNVPPHEVVEWFKLDLEPDLEGSRNAANETQAARKGKTVDQLVTDYISALAQHLHYTLRQKLGDTVLRSTPLEFVITVPAIWSDLAKQRTTRACETAVRKVTGISTTGITLVSEPEAAAIYALHGLDPHGLNVGDTFVVCDAGGGTVDLISYTITALKPILEVKETTPGTGALCGSTFLNRRFEQFLRAKLGDQDGFDNEVLAEAMERFEKTIKRQFTISAPVTETYTIPVGGLPNNRELGVTRGRYALKVPDLRTIFEPVIQQTLELVKEQISSSKVHIKAVLLVGGFGSSVYLKERLRAALDNKIQIMQPSNAWLAVVHGAVMKGLAQCAPTLTSVRVKNRAARKHYGTELTSKYDEVTHAHLISRRYWDGLDGIWRVPTMKWFIKRGDPVSENEPFFTPFVWTGLVSHGRVKKVTLELFADQTHRPAPIARDNNVRLLCRVEADLSHIPESELNRRRGQDGQWYYDLSCKIESLYHSASTSYTLIHKGQRYNSVMAEYV